MLHCFHPGRTGTLLRNGNEGGAGGGSHDLRRHPPPPIIVHASPIPVRDLGRLDRSFVGAPPLRLSAFRRMVDAASAPSSSAAFHGAGPEAGGSLGMTKKKAGGRPAVEWASEGDEELERAGCLIEVCLVRSTLARRAAVSWRADGEVYHRPMSPMLPRAAEAFRGAGLFRSPRRCSRWLRTRH